MIFCKFRIFDDFLRFWVTGTVWISSFLKNISWVLSCGLVDQGQTHFWGYYNVSREKIVQICLKIRKFGDDPYKHCHQHTS